jgi:hypothetical protein
LRRSRYRIKIRKWRRIIQILIEGKDVEEGKERRKRKAGQRGINKKNCKII